MESIDGGRVGEGGGVTEGLELNSCWKKLTSLVHFYNLPSQIVAVAPNCAIVLHI
jgi:hypothetical protein